VRSIEESVSVLAGGTVVRGKRTTQQPRIQAELRLTELKKSIRKKERTRKTRKTRITNYCI
jgi:hypothetical protein